jgi:hypothetical protein
LPSCLAYSWRLDAVVHRVADQVEQRVGKLLQHRLVQPEILSFYDQLDLLLALLGRHADGPMESRGQTRERDHPKVHQLLLNFAGQPFLPSEVRVEVAEEVAQLVVHGADVGGGLGQLARKKVEFRIAVQLELVEVLEGIDRRHHLSLQHQRRPRSDEAASHRRLRLVFGSSRAASRRSRPTLRFRSPRRWPS